MTKANAIVNAIYNANSTHEVCKMFLQILINDVLKNRLIKTRNG